MILRNNIVTYSGLPTLYGELVEKTLRVTCFLCYLLKFRVNRIMRNVSPVSILYGKSYKINS